MDNEYDPVEKDVEDISSDGLSYPRYLLLLPEVTVNLKLDNVAKSDYI